MSSRRCWRMHVCYAARTSRICVTEGSWRNICEKNGAMCRSNTFKSHTKALTHKEQQHLLLCAFVPLCLCAFVPLCLCVRSSLCCGRSFGLRLAGFHHWRIAPEVFEVVQFADVAAHDVDDDVEVIEDHPGGVDRAI